VGHPQAWQGGTCEGVLRVTILKGDATFSCDRQGVSRHVGQPQAVSYGGGEGGVAQCQQQWAGLGGWAGANRGFGQEDVRATRRWYIGMLPEPGGYQKVRGEGWEWSRRYGGASRADRDVGGHFRLLE
jgi:hypothetical protein